MKLEIDKAYTHDRTDIAILINSIESETDTHINLLGSVFRKKPIPVKQRQEVIVYTRNHTYEVEKNKIADWKIFDMSVLDNAVGRNLL